MKDKPPFILYSNLNKPQSSKFSKKYINNKMNIIYSRIPDQIVKKSPVIEKLIHPNPKIYYNIISKYKKPEFIKIDKNMQESQQKKISNLNEFKEMLYNYNKEEREQLENFVEIKKENNQFLHNYKKIQNEKNRFSTGTYLDHQYLIGIANHYAARGIKIPKISVNKNVFSTNPLILGGSDLENYFLYNLGDKKKSNIYLKKVNEIVNRKLAGNYFLSNEEIKRLEYLKKKEKPKDYVPPSELIPKLQNDINKSKFTYENLENFDKFFEEDETNKKAEHSNLRKISIPKMGSSRSSNDIFSNIYKTNIPNKYKIKKIIIKKNLSLIKRIKNNFNNKSIFSSSSTNAYGGSSQIFTSLNSQRHMPKIDNNKSSISSAVSRDNKYSPIISPFNHRNYSNLYNIKNINNNENDFFILSKPFDYPEKNIYNILYDNVSRGNNNKIIKKNLIIKNNSSNSIIGRKSLFSKEEKEVESEEDELRLLNKELEGKNENTNIEIDNSNEVNKILNVEEKKNSIDSNINSINTEKHKIKKIKFNKDLKIEPQSNKNEFNYNKIENIFNSLLENGYQSRRSKSEIKDFLQSRGYNTSKKVTSKDTYINVNKMKNKAIERNFLLEEFRIRNGDYSKIPLTLKQQAIIDKNELFTKQIERNEYILKKLLCEKNIEKDNTDY